MSNYVPGTPSSIDTLTATGLRKIAWDSKLRVDSVRPSVFVDDNLFTKFDINDMNEIVINKPGVMLDVSNVGKSQQGQSVKLALRIPLKKAARYGAGQDMLGNEDESDLYWTQAYYNEIKKAVKYNQWGYYANDTAYLNYNSGYNPLMAQFHAELQDTLMHQAILLSYAENLLYTPTSLTQQFNKNWCIPNLATSSYPTYDVDAPTQTNGAVDSDSYYPNRYYSGGTTFAENIGDALNSAGGAAATSGAILNVDNLDEICNYIVDQHVVEPIMLDGIPTRILTIPTKLKGWMSNPNNTGSLAAYTQNVADYKDPKRHTIIGEFGRVFEEFLLVHDTRYMTLTLGGSNGAWTLTPGYLWPGNNDDRNHTAWSVTSGSENKVFDLVLCLGANALMKYTRDALVSGLSETTEYGKIKGAGTYKGEGLQLPRFDKDSASQTASTQIYRGSAIIPVSRRNISSTL